MIISKYERDTDIDCCYSIFEAGAAINYINILPKFEVYYFNDGCIVIRISIAWLPFYLSYYFSYQKK